MNSNTVTEEHLLTSKEIKKFNKRARKYARDHNIKINRSFTVEDAKHVIASMQKAIMELKKTPSTETEDDVKFFDTLE